MKRVLARLKLHVGNNKRKTPFFDGYRPLFDISGCGLTSGMITLLDRKAFYPGGEGVVEIKFLDAEVTKGAMLFFYEGSEPLGECEVLETFEIAGE